MDDAAIDWITGAVLQALARRDMPGGPGPRSVTRQLTRAASLVKRNRTIS